jgi:hypothetical protein
MYVLDIVPAKLRIPNRICKKSGNAFPSLAECSRNRDAGLKNSGTTGILNMYIYVY